MWCGGVEMRCWLTILALITDASIPYKNKRDVHPGLWWECYLQQTRDLGAISGSERRMCMCSR